MTLEIIVDIQEADLLNKSEGQPLELSPFGFV
jgi:hypothetical protein